MGSVSRKNEFEQLIGPPVSNWEARSLPPATVMEGRTCRVEPLDLNRHARALYDANCEIVDGRSPDRNWTYLQYGPFGTFNEYLAWMQRTCFKEDGRSLKDDPLFYSIVDLSDGNAVGVASYMSIIPDHGVIQIGHIAFSPRMQRTIVGTEAMFLMMSRVFDELGYRRYEWKCDSLNAESINAATRLGFRIEGTFRQAVVYKGRNRDNTWLSVTDAEWPKIKTAFERWLDPSNFNATGEQVKALSSCFEPMNIPQHEA